MTHPSTHPESVQDYLADRLSAPDRLVFEDRLANDAGLVRELEETLKLREGLAMLRDRQELRPLQQPRRAALPMVFAAAAAVALVCVVLFVGLPGAGRSPAVIAASVAALRGNGGSPPKVVDRHTFVTVRGASETPALAVPAQGALELRVLAGAPHAGGAFRITLEKIGGDHASSSMGVAAPLAPDGDGFVVVYADGSRMQAGEYALLVQSTVENSDGGERFPFTLVRASAGR